MLNERRVSVDLSPHGIKVSSAGGAQPNTTVALSFPSPSGDGRFEVASRLARADLDGCALYSLISPTANCTGCANSSSAWPPVSRD